VDAEGQQEDEWSYVDTADENVLLYGLSVDL
jgi:hypothetical protein